MSETSCLEARHLRKAYGSRKVVHDVSMKVNKGEVVGLLGPNGAGKTTTVNLFLNFIAPSAGQALVCGIDSARAWVCPTRRRRPRCYASGRWATMCAPSWSCSTTTRAAR